MLRETDNIKLTKNKHSQKVKFLLPFEFSF